MVLKPHLLARHFDAIMVNLPTVRIRPGEEDRLVALHREFPNGCDVVLEAGFYHLRETVKLTSNLRLTGTGTGTVLELAPGSNCHIFTNVDHSLGNENVYISDIVMKGNGDSQSRPDTAKALAFSCGFYFRNVTSIVVENLSLYNIRQTALHFSRCINVVSINIEARQLGWSGISSSGTSNIYVHALVEDAGLDVRHSAIHMDGGYGIFVDAEVCRATGNGIMLDSAFSPLRGACVKGVAKSCMRGVSLSGSNVNELSNVVITGTFTNNAQSGVMVSNSANVFINSSVIRNNGEYGVLFQGRTGGRNCVVANCDVQDNGKDFSQIHGSHTNWIFPNLSEIDSFFSSDLNEKSLKSTLGTPYPWFCGKPKNT